MGTKLLSGRLTGRRSGLYALGVLLVLLIGLVWTAAWPGSGWSASMPEWFPVPQEDAYILYRYSENLATSGQIAWNVDDGPADGATDFLWMLVLAGWALVFGQVIPGIYILGALLTVAA